MKFFSEFLILSIVGMCLFMHSACLKPEVDIDENMPLAFSEDTVLFDTVFTSRGSATQILKIYNTSSSDIETEVFLEKRPSYFRLNIDGVTVDGSETISVPAMDSLYVFIEVTVDPDQPLSVSPFVIQENLHFRTDFQDQMVVLTAWGQNANYITSKDQKRRISLITCNMQEWEWTDPKPYVIFGVLIIDSCNVIWPEGVQIYVHGGVVNNQIGIYNDGLLFFDAHATLTSKGTPDRPVCIQADRLEAEFEDVPGQWNGLRFNANSNADLRYTIIKNAVNGLVLDSGSTADLEACQILNSGGIGLAARHAAVSATNCLLATGSVHPVQLTFGGQYEFTYCTIVNYGRPSQAFLANNFTCYDQSCNKIAINTLNLQVRNSIIAGSTEDQLALINAASNTIPFQLEWENNLVRVEDFLDDNPNFFDQVCTPCWNYESSQTLFQAPFEMDFQLDSTSQALDKATYLPSVSTDALGRTRDMDTPDLGCFEFNQP